MMDTIEFKTITRTEFAKYQATTAVALLKLNDRISQLEDRLAKFEDAPKRGRKPKGETLGITSIEAV